MGTLCTTKWCTCHYKRLEPLQSMTSWSHSWSLTSLPKPLPWRRNHISKGSQALLSMLSPKQILQFIQSSIRPAIAHSMCLGIYTPYDIHMLDSILLHELSKKQ